MSRLRNIILLALLVIIGLFIQGTFIRSFVPAAYAPDLILILVIMLGLTTPTVWGLLGAFSLGLLADFATAAFVGPNAAGTVIAFGLVVYWSQKVFAEKGLAVAILGFFSSIAKSLACILMLSLYVHVRILTWDTLFIVLVEGLATAALTPLVLKIVSLRSSNAGRSYSFGRELA